MTTTLRETTFTSSGKNVPDKAGFHCSARPLPKYLIAGCYHSQRKHGPPAVPHERALPHCPAITEKNRRSYSPKCFNATCIPSSYIFWKLA